MIGLCFGCKGGTVGKYGTAFVSLVAEDGLSSGDILGSPLCAGEERLPVRIVFSLGSTGLSCISKVLSVLLSAADDTCFEMAEIFTRSAATGDESWEAAVGGSLGGAFGFL